MFTFIFDSNPLNVWHCWLVFIYGLY